MGPAILTYFCENVAQLGLQLVALGAWKHVGLSVLLEQVRLSASQVATAQLLVIFLL